jgi:23S rRNA pseudouridine1911/1915/1917 synthase
LTLVYGKVKEDWGYIDVPIGRSFRQRKMAVAGRANREAITHFKVLEWLDNFSLLEVRLETGRTHQIRVHMAYIKHPVVGDPEYGGAKLGKELGLERQFLHASGLALVHPRTGEELSFEDPLPQDLERVLAKLSGGTSSGN